MSNEATAPADSRPLLVYDLVVECVPKAVARRPRPVAPGRDPGGVQALAAVGQRLALRLALF
jgi:hypothetical protein